MPKPATVTHVNFNDAKMLSQNNQDVIVFDRASGDIAKFEDERWPFGGAKSFRQQILIDIGIGSVDDHFVFIWMQEY